jgi:mono/diheme cytochrome c family protein
LRSEGRAVKLPLLPWASSDAATPVGGEGTGMRLLRGACSSCEGIEPGQGVLQTCRRRVGAGPSSGQRQHGVPVSAYSRLRC